MRKCNQPSKHTRLTCQATRENILWHVSGIIIAMIQMIEMQRNQLSMERNNWRSETVRGFVAKKQRYIK